MTTWTKMEPLPSKSNPCLCCPPILSRADMEKVIAVGFGSAYVTCDGRQVYSEPHPAEEGDGAIYWTFAEAENVAKDDPDHDWRVTMFGPLHGETYQRHGEGEWNLVEKNEGFA